MQFVWIILAVFFVWTLILTISFLSLYNHYNKLLKDTTKKTLQTLLEEILSNLDVQKKGIEMLKNRCDTIEKEGKYHIQKIGLLRYNPFKDTGGDQSFILALIDGQDSGVVVSGLYSRSGTRWYAKGIKNGKGIDYELSEEEKKAITQSKHVI